MDNLNYLIEHQLVGKELLSQNIPQCTWYKRCSCWDEVIEFQNQFPTVEAFNGLSEEEKKEVGYVYLQIFPPLGITLIVDKFNSKYRRCPKSFGETYLLRGNKANHTPIFEFSSELCHLWKKMKHKSTVDATISKITQL